MSPFEFTPSPVFSKFDDLHKSIWGKSWKASKITVQAASPTEIPQPALTTSTEAHPVIHITASLEPGVSNPQEYDVFKGLRSLVTELGSTSDISDLLVGRVEYTQLLDRILTGDLRHFNKMVVTGHPGIGKTSFLLFVFLHRMQLELPTAIQFRPKKYFIFNRRGVIERSEGGITGSDPELAECWALADSSNAVTEPSLDFQTPDTPERVIQTTSPRPDRWSAWAKHTGATLVIMDLPSALDIAAVAYTQGFNYTKALGLMKKWGPSLRTIHRIFTGSTAVARHTANVTSAATAFKSPGVLDPFLEPSEDNLVALNSKSSSIIFLRPKRLRRAAGEGDIDDVEISRIGDNRIVEIRGVPTFVIPTAHLRDIFEKSRVQMTDEAAFQLFEVLSTHPLTRGATGWHHEVRVHRRLRFGESPLQIYDVTGEQRAMPLARRVLMGTASALRTINLDDFVYWMPSALNFPGIDGVLIADRNVYAVQSTVSPSHSSPIDGLKSAWSGMGAMARDFDWHVVFITRELPYNSHVLRWHNQLRLNNNRIDVKVWGCTLYPLHEQPDDDDNNDDDDNGNDDNGSLDGSDVLMDEDFGTI